MYLLSQPKPTEILVDHLSMSVASWLQFDISFFGLPCEWISLDAMDISGDMHLDVASPLPLPLALILHPLFEYPLIA